MGGGGGAGTIFAQTRSLLPLHRAYAQAYTQAYASLTGPWPVDVVLGNVLASQHLFGTWPVLVVS